MSNVTQAWLADPTHILGLLVEITAKNVSTGTDTTFYLSNIGYTTTSADITYLPYLSGNIQTTESITIDGSLSMSFGDIQVANYNGDLDDWLDSTKYIWVNRPIQVYLGDPTWVTTNLADIHTQFEKVFDGIIEDVDSSARESINVKVRDKLNRLNYPISDNTLGTYGTWANGQTNQDTIRPLVFGEVFNMSPILVDPAYLEYMFNDGATELGIEIRDNGVPIYTDTTVYGTTVTATAATTNYIYCVSTQGLVTNASIIFDTSIGNIIAGTTYSVKSIVSPTIFTISIVADGPVFTLTTATASGTIRVRNINRPDRATVNLTTGKFTLTIPPEGTITMSLQGLKKSVDLSSSGTAGALSTYTNNIGNIITLITTQYGQVNNRLTSSDLDLVNLRAFVAANTAPIGIVVKDRVNVLEICQKIAASASAQLFFNRKGLLQLLQLGTYTSDAVMDITDADILHHSLHISNRTKVVAATKVGYALNYTPQTALAGQLTPAANTMFQDEWYSQSIADTTVQTNYKLDVTPVQTDTSLIRGADATALATKLNNYFKVPRTVYAFTGTAKLMYLKLGQQVTLTHNRFGLISGKSGQVITLSPNWADGTINVEVII